MDVRTIYPSLEIMVHGIPAPQGSKRHVGRGILVESSKAVGPWREAIRAETQLCIMGGMEPLDGPLHCDMTFRLPRPKSHYGKRGIRPSAPDYPAGRPDIDKLARAVLDGITQGGGIADDSRIVTLWAQKRFADDDESPGVTVYIETEL